MYVRIAGPTTLQVVLCSRSHPAIDNLSRRQFVFVRHAASLYKIVYKPLDSLISLSFAPLFHLQWVGLTFSADIWQRYMAAFPTPTSDGPHSALHLPVEVLIPPGKHVGTPYFSASYRTLTFTCGSSTTLNNLLNDVYGDVVYWRPNLSKVPLARLENALFLNLRDCIRPLPQALLRNPLP